MQRYVFLYKGEVPDTADLERIAATPSLRIINREISHAMLVEADERVIEKLRPHLSEWIISPEVFYRKPEPQ